MEIPSSSPFAPCRAYIATAVVITAITWGLLGLLAYAIIRATHGL